MQPASCKSLLDFISLRLRDTLSGLYSDFSALFPAANSIAPATAHGTPIPIATPPVDFNALPYLNIVKGFTGCDRNLLEVGDAFGYSKYEKFRYIVLPYASADILVGMRIGMGYSWRAIIGAEMIAASTGIGHMILFAQEMSRTDKVIVGIFVIGIVGLLTDKIFGLALNKLFKGNGEHGWN